MFIHDCLSTIGTVEQLLSKGIEGQTMVEVFQRHSGPVFSVLGLVGESSNLPSSVPYGGYWMQFIPSTQSLPTPETGRGTFD